MQSKKKAKRSLRRYAANVVNGNTIPGHITTIFARNLKRSEVHALNPANWMNRKLNFEASRMKKGHGLVFSAEVKMPRRKPMRIRVKPIRKHYNDTHEMRMLEFLTSNGFIAEEPLGVLLMPDGERYLVTKIIEMGGVGSQTQVNKLKRELKRLKIVPDDLDTGKRNYGFVDGKPALFDVEHYYSVDPKSKLHFSRMLKE